MAQPERDQAQTLSRLRLATAKSHAQLDAGLPLSKPQPGLEDYIAHLGLLYEWLVPIARVIHAEKIGPFADCDQANQDALQLLANDLKAAGSFDPLAIEAGDFISIPRAYQPAPFMWGMQYVVEGSYLGATFLNKKMQPLLNNQPMHFFRQAAAWSKNRWPHFQHALHTHLQLESDLAAAESGATFAFERIAVLAQPLMSREQSIEHRYHHA